MILGASHMTLTCKDMGAALQELAGLGYTASFIERNLPNAQGKAPFLSRSYSQHDLAFTRTSHGLPIELIRYDGWTSGGHGEFSGYFAGAAGVNARADEEVRPTAVSFKPAGASPDAAAAYLTTFRTSATFDPAAQPPGGLTMAGLKTADIASARRFWCEGLGYKVVDDKEDWCKLVFRSPVPAWNFSVVLEAGTPPPQPAMLDSVGMTCFSHLCSSPAKDRQRLIDAGATAASGVFEMKINGKLLSVEIFRGPSGEFIELLQVST